MNENGFVFPANLPTPAKPKFPQISLETMPASGIISRYGVCESDRDLVDYARNYLEKMERFNASRENSGVSGSNDILLKRARG